MTDELERLVNEFREDGYTDQEIREALREEGYRDAVIDSILDEKQPPQQPVDDKPAKQEPQTDWLWRGQKYSWLLFFTGLLAVYVFVAVYPEKVVLQVPVGGEYSIVYLLLSKITTVPVIAGLLLFHLGAGIYQWRFHDVKWKGMTSVGAVIGRIVVAIVGAVLLFLVTQPFRTSMGPALGLGGTELFGQSLSFLLVYVNSVMFIIAGVAGFFFRRQIGYYAAVFPLIFLLLFAGIWGMQYMQITDAADTMEPPKFKTAVGASHANANSTSLLHAAARTPPPLTKAMAMSATVANVGGMFARWDQIEREALNTVRTGPEIVCGGTQANVKERFGDSPMHTVLFTQWRLIQGIKEHKEQFIDFSQKRCPRMSDCTATRQQLAADYDKLVSWYERGYNTTASLLIGEQPDFTGLIVDDCSPPPEKYYGVNVTDISCSDPFTVTMENVGTRPISGAPDVYVYNKEGRMQNGGDLEAVADWRRGRKTLSIDRWSSQWYDESGFATGEPYKINIELKDAELDFSAYCTGGNGFCETCHKAQQQDEYGFNETVIAK